MTGLVTVGVDVGAATIKVVSKGKANFFPHAINFMTDSEVEAMKLSEPTSSIVQSSYRVEYRLKREWVGGWVTVGTRAMRSGAGSVKFGAARYEKDYYGVLGAIALWCTGIADESHVHFAGTHPSEYQEYARDIQSAMLGQWRVEHKGKVKTYSVDKVSLMHEPVAAFRHVMLPIDGVKATFPRWLRTDTILGLDFGGFTLGVMAAESLRVDYTSSASLPYGMLDVLDELWALMRSKYRKELKEISFPDMGKLRWALAHGGYPAGGYGNLDVKDLAARARQKVLNTIPSVISRMGGIGSYGGVFLAGGGVADMGKEICAAIGHPKIHLADSPDKIVFAAANGAYRAALLAQGA